MKAIKQLDVGFDESSGSIPDMHTFSVESQSSELFRKISCVYIEF